MAFDEAVDGKRRTSPHSSSGSQHQRRLFTILFALSTTVTISLLFFFYHIRIKIKPSGKLDAEQKDDERGHGFEIWEIVLASCVPLFTWRFRWQLSRLLQRCFVAMQQHQQRRKSSMIIIMTTLLCLALIRQILYRPSLCNIKRGDSWITTDVGYIRTHPHTSSLGVSMRTLCDGRVWEPWVARAIEQHLYGQGRAIDVGAFIGYHTIRLAKAAAPHKVYAFEGRPSSDLTENIMRNNAKNVHLVTDTIDENWILSPQLERELLNNNDEDDGKGNKEEDDIEGPPVSLIKIDCEGCELHFLRGAKKVLQKYHPVLIIEIQDDDSRKNAKVGGQRMIQPNKESRQDVLDYLSNELGYIVEALRDDDGVETWDYLAYAI